MSNLKMAQSLVAAFYLPQLVAQELGTFRDEALTVEFVTSFGKQWDLLESGAVDIAIGGPTRNMDCWTKGGTRIVNFCAALQANTWFLIARQPIPNFKWSDLAGRIVIGLRDAPQGVCLRWTLLEHGVDRVKIVGGENTAQELEMFRSGQGDYLLHSLHSAAPLVESGDFVVVQDLATPTGFVPWSTFAALPRTLETRRTEIQAFTRGIARAFTWIEKQPGRAIAALLPRYFPSWPSARLAEVISTYKRLNTWPETPVIPRPQWDHYCAMYVAVGALSRAVQYDELVDEGFASEAIRH
jgi:NitT/TauT family transport system substrate-binding protein